MVTPIPTTPTASDDRADRITRLAALIGSIQAVADHGAPDPAAALACITKMIEEATR